MGGMQMPKLNKCPFVLLLLLFWGFFGGVEGAKSRVLFKLQGNPTDLPGSGVKQPGNGVDRATVHMPAGRDPSASVRAAGTARNACQLIRVRTEACAVGRDGSCSPCLVFRTLLVLHVLSGRFGCAYWKLGYIL